MGGGLDVGWGMGDVTLTLLLAYIFSSYGACHVEPLQSST